MNWTQANLPLFTADIMQVIKYLYEKEINMQHFALHCMKSIHFFIQIWYFLSIKTDVNDIFSYFLFMHFNIYTLHTHFFKITNAD